jgi:hypothetical protein
MTVSEDFKLSSDSVNELNTGKGTKDDFSKLRFSLIPAEFVRALARLYTIGAKKYAAWNWLNKLDRSRFEDALDRHLNAYKAGWLYDRQTGTHHLVAVAWNACAIFIYDVRGIDRSPVDEWIKPDPSAVDPDYTVQ